MIIYCTYQGDIEVPDDFNCSYCDECDFCYENSYGSDYKEEENN